MSNLVDDATILQEISAGQMAHATIHIAYRQMKALEAIAESAVKWANPPQMAPMIAHPMPKFNPPPGSYATTPSDAGVALGDPDTSTDAHGSYTQENGVKPEPDEQSVDDELRKLTE